MIRQHDINAYDPDRKMILVDFDGVLHSYKRGWAGADIITDAPLPGAIEWLSSLVQNKFLDVRIFSARCNDPLGIVAMRCWLMKHGFPIQLLDSLTFQPGKPKAHLIIDDRAQQFVPFGGLSEDMYVPYNETRITQFEPWYYNHPDWRRK